MATARDVVEGKPVRCPLHPALVHFPLAAFTLGVALDIASWIAPHAELQFGRASFIALAVGVVTALLAAVTGFVDYSDIRTDHPAKKTATLHMALNLVSVALFAVSLGLRYGHMDVAPTPGWPFGLALVGFAILGYSGYLGGVLVYDDGIAVGRHRRRTPTPDHTIIASKQAAGDYAVPGIADLRPGEIRRVSAGGTIAAVTKVGGRLCAFQEFCTHRYGPLSEGKIEHGRVVCPWHGSTFDTATGKVTQGPAKIDLRSFPTEETNGAVRLRIPPLKK